MIENDQPVPRGEVELLDVAMNDLAERARTIRNNTFGNEDHLCECVNELAEIVRELVIRVASQSESSRVIQCDIEP